MSRRTGCGFAIRRSYDYDYDDDDDDSERVLSNVCAHNVYIYIHIYIFLGLPTNLAPPLLRPWCDRTLPVLDARSYSYLAINFARQLDAANS